MTRKRAILIGVSSLVLAGSGAVVASAWNDVPQDAVPLPQDATGDLNRQQVPPPAPQEPEPEATPAPTAPVAITPQTPPAIEIVTGKLDEEEAEEDEAPAPVVADKPIEAPAVPLRRQRKRVAIVEAVDKVTAERMRFEVPVGGRPVRFEKSLIFRARACEVSTPDEAVQDSIAYLEISVQARGVLNMAEPRQVFRGWMFASSPTVSGMEHPVYDAWVIGCKA